MKTCALGFLRAAALVVLVLGARASSAGEPPAKGPPPLTLAPVVVTATRAEASSLDVPASIDTVDREVIEDDKPQVLISEDLQRVPGTTVQNRGAFAQEEQITIRGFGARSQFGTRGIRLYADGIPTSTPDGQGSSAMFDLASADRIEVLRGAFSALYGNHSGGVVQVFTRSATPRPTLMSRLMLGSYGTYVLGLQFSGTADRAGFVADVSQFHTKGYRQRSAAEKAQVHAKIDFELPTGARLSLVFNYLAQPDSLDPGGLTAAEAASDPTQASASAVAFKTRRDLDDLQGGIVYNQELGSRDRVQLVGYLGRRGNTQFLAIPLAAQDALTASGGVSSFERVSLGVRGLWTHQEAVAGGPLTLVAGGEFDQAREARQGELNDLGSIAAPPGVQGVQKRNEVNTTPSFGVFGQGQWQFLPAWGLALGLRYTQVRVASDDHFICTTTVNTTGTPLGTCSGSSLAVTPTLFNPDDSGHVSLSALTPVAGLLYRLAPGARLYVNVGRSFETPTLAELAYRPDGLPGLNFQLRPATSWQYEVGSKILVGSTARIDLALFHIDTADEIVVDTSLGGRSTYRNAPGTRRNGVELSVESFLPAGFSFYVSGTYMVAVFSSSFPTANGGAPVLAGKDVPGVPRATLFGALTWSFAPLGFRAGIEGFGQGRIEVDDRNTQAAAAYGLAGAHAGFEQKWGGFVLGEFVRGSNLFDARYVSAVAINDAGGRFYYPGPRRSYLIGLRAALEF